jgi:hypothetical protein
MTQEQPTAANSKSTNQLKSIFERSVAVLCKDKDTLKKDSQSRRIRQSLPLHADSANIQKRALEDAAKALATLWKISEPGRAKLPSRVMHYNRQAT